MGETLTEQRRVDDEGPLGRKVLSGGTKVSRVNNPGSLTVPSEEAPANSVPAAAVIRGGLALFGITGRKGRVGG